MVNKQISFWKGNFGDEYSVRISGDADKLYKKEFGMTRTSLNKEFLSGLSKDLKILEIGCNIGLQLTILEKSGFNNLWAIEINKNALLVARENKGFNIVEAKAQDIPFKNNFFDLVFSSRVLIHIAPNNIFKVIDELYRVTKKYIWCFEYFSEECEEINYRGNKNSLWKNNFLRLFLERHPDLKVVKKKELEYLDTDNVDMMFLLEKVGETKK